MILGNVPRLLCIPLCAAIPLSVEELDEDTLVDDLREGAEAEGGICYEAGVYVHMSVNVPLYIPREGQRPKQYGTGLRANHERKFGAVVRRLSRWFGPVMVRKC